MEVFINHHLVPNYNAPGGVPKCQLCILGDCVGLSNSCILRLAAQYLSFCLQMEINEENRGECRACFIKGLYQDLLNKYDDALAKNVELVTLTSELCAENEQLNGKQQ